jgi:hypothetical protein
MRRGSFNDDDNDNEKALSSAAASSAVSRALRSGEWSTTDGGSEAVRNALPSLDAWSRPAGLSGGSDRRA